ncbi:MAG: hypothetical protein QXL91_02025 [Candidatus Bathyarchaeia archaeon]
MPFRELAFKDEVATLSDNLPSDIGTSASAGTGTSASRYDHVHKIGAGAINNSNMFAAGVVNETALAAGAVSTAKIQDGAVTPAKMNINANLNFNENEAVALALENLSTAPSTTKAGRIYFDTSTGRVKVYVP